MELKSSKSNGNFRRRQEIHTLTLREAMWRATAPFFWRTPSQQISSRRSVSGIEGLLSSRYSVAGFRNS